MRLSKNQSTKHQASSFTEEVFKQKTLLKPIFELKLLENDKKSANFIRNLNLILDGELLEMDYNKDKVSDFYLTWLLLLDSSVSLENKKSFCNELYKKYHSEEDPIGEYICDLPIVVAFPILAFSDLNVLISTQQKIDDYFIFFEENHLYFSCYIIYLISVDFIEINEKTIFLENILKIYNNASSLLNNLDHAKEAVCYWKRNLTIMQYQNLCTLSKTITNHNEAITELVQTRCSSIKHELLNPVKVNPFYLDREFDKLVFSTLAQDVDLTTLTPLMFWMHKKEDFYFLEETFKKLGEDPKSLIRLYLVRSSEFINAGILVELQKKGARASRFFSEAINYLEGGDIIENQKCFEKISDAIPSEFYIENFYAFSKINRTLFYRWKSDNVEKFINILKEIIRSHAENDISTNRILISGFLHAIEEGSTRNSFNSVETDFFDEVFCKKIIKNLDVKEFIVFFSLVGEHVRKNLSSVFVKCCSEEIAFFDNLKQLINQEKNLQDFPKAFLKDFLAQVRRLDCGQSIVKDKIINFFSQIVATQSETVDSDLKDLSEILENKPPIEQYKAIAELKVLHAALDKGESCLMVIKMFNAVDSANWPYLFLHFYFSIAVRSFPRSRRFLAHRKSKTLKPPGEKQDTWLQHEDEFKNILVETLKSVAAFEPRVLAVDPFNRILVYLETILEEGNSHFPGLKDKILKEVFLSAFPRSVIVFHRMKKFEHTKLASWFPADRKKRIKMLSDLFYIQEEKYPGALLDDYKIDVFQFPFVRDSDEERQLAKCVYDNRKVDFFKFIYSLSFKCRLIIMEGLFKLDPDNLVRLIDFNLRTLELLTVYNAYDKISLPLMLLNVADQIGMDICSLNVSLKNNRDFLKVYNEFESFSNLFFENTTLIFKIIEIKPSDEFYQRVESYMLKEMANSLDKGQLDFFNYTVAKMEKISLMGVKNKTFIEYLLNSDKRNEYAMLIINNMAYYAEESEFNRLKIAIALEPSLPDRIIKYIKKSLEGEKFKFFTRNKEALLDKFKYTLDQLIKICGNKKIHLLCQVNRMPEMEKLLDTNQISGWVEYGGLI